MLPYVPNRIPNLFHIFVKDGNYLFKTLISYSYNINFQYRGLIHDPNR